VGAIVESVARTRKLVVVEEGATGFDLASEVVTAVSLADRGRDRLHFRRLAAHPVPIPSAQVLEHKVLPCIEDICRVCQEIFDE